MGLQSSCEILGSFIQAFLCLVSVTQLLEPAHRNEGYPELQPAGCSQSHSASMGKPFLWAAFDPNETAEFWKTDKES